MVVKSRRVQRLTKLTNSGTVTTAAASQRYSKTKADGLRRLRLGSPVPRLKLMIEIR
jgi:hypothetical protein